MYRLHHVKLDTIPAKFNVRKYPKTDYVNNPILSKIKEEIECVSDEELSRSPVFIIGQLGRRKLNAGVHLVDVFRKRLSKKWSFLLYHPPKLTFDTK